MLHISSIVPLLHLYVSDIISSQFEITVAHVFVCVVVCKCDNCGIACQSCVVAKHHV